MRVRLAEHRDLEACGNLDHSYTTDCVWQMDAREGDGSLAVNFRVARLPREMRMDYPLRGEHKLASWRRRDGFLVAEGVEGVCGYVTLTSYTEHGIAWMGDLIVNQPHRRRGIGTALLRAAAGWGRDQELVRLVTAVQTKNYPAAQFYRSRGLTFCGYTDHYWPSRDIALFWGESLR